MNPALGQRASDYIGGRFVPIDGDELISHNPAAPDEIIWQGDPDPGHVDDAVNAAREACGGWSRTPLEDRIAILRRWQEVTKKHAERMAGLITDEMGKTLAESRLEAGALGAKVDITLDEHSISRVREYEVDAGNSRAGQCRFKPHGVMAVIAPFNFPAHLANGHFVPALLMGNTIVLKPSDKTPGVGQLIAELMHEARMPPGVFNVVQGGANVASTLVAHERIGGILFTGSWPVGRKILEANLDHPGRIIALEMGGNNPAVIMPSANLKQAVVECIRATFATTGQRCTCTRRLIVHRSIADRFISAFCKMASTILIGPGRSDEPVFMGPLISEEAADAVVKAQKEMAKHHHGKVLIEAARMDHEGHFVTPGIVEVERFSLEHDREVFGPFAQIAVVDDLDDAIAQANMTHFGLAASIFTSDDEEWREFFHRCCAGCINRNTGTAGASSKLPFGGVGRSGNHRPAAAFSVDYCAYPVASMIERGEESPIPPGVHWDENWL